MKVKDVMVKSVVGVNSNETVSAAFSKIKKHNINQLPIINENKYMGMLSLKNIVTKNIDPKMTKCGNLAVNTPSLQSEDTLEAAAETLLNSGFRALPVMDNNNIVGIISETDIIAAADKISKNSLDVQMTNIATECEYATRKDKIGKVKNIMVYKNVSRVPVVDSGKVVGVVGMLDLVKLLEGKEPMQARGGRLKEAGTKEKINIEDTLVESIMHVPVVLDGNASLKDAIGSLKTYEEVIISDGSVKIITPKDVLELIVRKPAKDLHVQIIGMDEESPLFKLKTKQAVDEFMKKMEKMVERIQYLFVHVEKYNKGGTRQKYSIRVRFGTPMGLFVAKAWGWNPATVAQEAMNNLEKEVLHKYGKKRTDIKKRRIISKRR